MEISLFENLEKRIKDLEKRILTLENVDKTLFWKDPLTGLYWELKEDKDVLCNYLEASKYIENLNRREYAGFSNWDFPTKKELETLFDLDKDEPYIKQELIENIPSKFKPIFWSSTKDKERKTLRWIAYFNYGYGDFKYRSHNYYFMAVRKEIL